MSAPKRIQRERTKDWKMPENTVCVGRPSKWRNPCHLIGKYTVVDENGYHHHCAAGEARGVAVRLFREALYNGYLDIDVVDIEESLRGKDLACWCDLDLPCHADVLLEIANGVTA